MNYEKPEILESHEAMSSIQGHMKPPQSHLDSITHVLNATAGAYEADE